MRPTLANSALAKNASSPRSVEVLARGDAAAVSTIVFAAWGGDAEEDEVGEFIAVGYCVGSVA